MSEENVEIVRAAIDAFDRSNWDAALKDLSPNSELDFSRAVGPIHGVYGRERAREFIDELTEPWESTRIEPHEFIAAGDHVVVPLTGYSTGRDGIEVPARTTWTYTIRDGAIERMCMYQEREEALEAVSLSE